jgi:hypothetical protein
MTVTTPQSGAQVIGGSSPTQRISMPDYVDWHMILDHELSQLSRPEIGFIGSLGLVGLGAALGSAVQFWRGIAKVLQPAEGQITGDDIGFIMVFVASVVLAIVCLTISGVGLWRNRGLAQQIRKRDKRGLQMAIMSGDGTNAETA